MISITGIQVQTISVDLKNQEERITSHYALISSNGGTLATQAVGGYGGLKIPLTVDTNKAFEAFLEKYKNDIENFIGLNAN